MFLTENSSQVFFLRLGNMVHSHMQSIKSLSAFRIKCNIRRAVERIHISQMSVIEVYD